MNRKTLKDRIYLATTGKDYEKLASETGFGLELDQFCYSDYLDLREESNADCEALRDLGASGAEAFREAKRLSELFPKPIFHGPFTELYPAAIDPKGRAFAMERMLQAYDIAEKLGAKRIVFHSGYVPYIYFKEWHVERSAEFWAELRDAIAKRRIERGLPPFTVLVENVLDDGPDLLCNTMERLRQIPRKYTLAKRATDAQNCENTASPHEEKNAADTASPHEEKNAADAASPHEDQVSEYEDYVEINVCLDIGHANCASDVPVERWIDKLAPYLKHMHVQNNTGEYGLDPHNPPQDGSLNAKALVEQAEELCKDMTYTLECYDLARACEWARDCLGISKEV